MTKNTLFAAAATLSVVLLSSPAWAENLRPSENSAAAQNDPAIVELVQPEFFPDGLGENVVLSLPVDLNNDGQKEQIVELGKEYCGTAGCETLILSPAADGTWKILFDDHVTKMESGNPDAQGWYLLEIDGLSGAATYGYNGDVYAPQQ